MGQVLFAGKERNERYVDVDVDQLNKSNQLDFDKEMKPEILKVTETTNGGRESKSRSYNC